MLFAQRPHLANTPRRTVQMPKSYLPTIPPFVNLMIALAEAHYIAACEALDEESREMAMAAEVAR